MVRGHTSATLLIGENADIKTVSTKDSDTQIQPLR